MVIVGTDCFGLVVRVGHCSWILGRVTLSSLRSVHPSPVKVEEISGNIIFVVLKMWLLWLLRSGWHSGRQ